MDFLLNLLFTVRSWVARKVLASSWVSQKLRDRAKTPLGLMRPHEVNSNRQEVAMFQQTIDRIKIEVLPRVKEDFNKEYPNGFHSWRFWRSFLWALAKFTLFYWGALIALVLISHAAPPFNAWLVDVRAQETSWLGRFLVDSTGVWIGLGCLWLGFVILRNSFKSTLPNREVADPMTETLPVTTNTRG